MSVFLLCALASTSLLLIASSGNDLWIDNESQIPKGYARILCTGIWGSGRLEKVSR
jgi:hypothetical protein